MAEDTHVTVFLIVTHHPIVWNVAPDEAAIVTDIDRTFSPPEPGGDSLNGGVTDLVFEPLVKRLDTWIGVPPIGKISEGQGVSSCRKAGGCIRSGRFDRHAYCGSSCSRHECPSFHDKFLPDD